MEGEFSTSGFSDALVILGAAGIVIPAFARLKISPVIGFIIVGMIVGPFGLGALAAEHPWLDAVTITDRAGIEPFADFGIILLLFAIGLELSFRRLAAMRRSIFGIGAAEMVLGTALIGFGLWLFGEAPASAATLGVALAMSSTALVLPIAGMNSPVGRAAFAMLLFEDLALVPLLFVLASSAPVSTLPLVFLKGLAVIAAMLVAGRFLLPPLFGQAART
jgi:CPA2 family monovalent cation:H+ antiporter-2